MQFGHEEDHHAGPGGSPWYNRDWTTRTWDVEVLDALAVGMANAAAAPAPQVVVVDEPDADLDDDFEALDDYDYSEADLERDRKRDIDRVWVWVGVVVAAVVAGAVAAPHAKRLWNEKVEPPAKRLWRKVTKGGPDALEESSAAEEPAEPDTDAVLGEATKPGPT